MRFRTPGAHARSTDVWDITFRVASAVAVTVAAITAPMLLLSLLDALIEPLVRSDDQSGETS